MSFADTAANVAALRVSSGRAIGSLTGTPARARCGADRWQAAARRVWQEMQDARGIGSTYPYSASDQEAFRDVLRLALR